MTTELMEKLEAIPKWKARVEQHRAEARAGGLAEGREEGLAEGREGLAKMLLRYFELRGDSPAEHVVARIRACTDAGTLQVWLDLAYRGQTSAQIFG